ncbi:MAG: hypothetical protein NT001_03625 [Candidatus Woesearchaeota archaeon]|nr:hypothetical protein [Candidatus Woesearchaeota archaeon]
MSGLEGKVMIIPSTDVGSLSDAVGKGIDMMQSEGISHFFFDTDLDSFDSTVIKGVDYCLQLPVQAIKCMFDKFPKESGMLYSIAEASRDHRLSAALKRLRLSLGEIRKNGNDETDINNISGYAYDAYLQLRAVVGSASYSSRSIDVFIKKLIDVSETALYEMRKINQKGLPIDNIDAELKKLRETLEGKCLLGIDVTEFEPGNDYNGKTESLLKKLIHNLYGLNAR